MQHKQIFHNGNLLAVLVRDINTANRTQFFTPEDNVLQIGTIVKQSRNAVQPHYHTCKPFRIQSVQECFYVVTGKVKATILSSEAIVVQEIILSPHSALLTISGGHGFEFLEDSILFELKQGPFTENLKVIYSDTTTKLKR